MALCECVYSTSEGKMQPSTSASAVCLRDRCEALLLPRPRLRWTAMWAFPSNIAQRLASGRPLAGNYFFSSLILGDNSYLSVAVCFAYWCGGGGHQVRLFEKGGGGVLMWLRFCKDTPIKREVILSHFLFLSIGWQAREAIRSLSMLKLKANLNNFTTQRVTDDNDGRGPPMKPTTRRCLPYITDPDSRTGSV